MHRNTQETFLAFISDTGWLFIHIDNPNVKTWYPLIRLTEEQHQQYKGLAIKYHEADALSRADNNNPTPKHDE